METAINVLSHLNLWNISQFLELGFGFLILLKLITVSKGLKRYIPLIGYVIIVILQLVSDLISGSSLIQNFPHLLYLLEPFNMLSGALLYLYVRNMEQQQFRLIKTDWFLLVPFFLSLMTYLPYYFMDAVYKLNDFAVYGSVRNDVAENIWEWIFEVSINVGFLWLALRHLAKYNQKIKAQFSDVQQLDLHLTRMLLKVLMGIYLVEMLFVYMTYFGFPYYEVLFYSLQLLSFAFLFLIAYDAIISNKHILAINKAWLTFPESEIDIDGQIVKYAKSSLTIEMSLKLKEDLEHYMDENKPFLESKIRIKDISEKMGIPSHQISQVINESFQQNFYEFVNAYRVKEAIKLLKDPKFKNFTSSAIGFEVGFNSKSTFYNSFKKLTGTTPAKF